MCVRRMRVSDVNRMDLSGKISLRLLYCGQKLHVAMEKKTSFLPMVSPAYGLLGVNWCAAFFTTRRELDLTWTSSCCHLLTLCVTHMHTPFPQHVWTRGSGSGSGSCFTRPPPLLSSGEAKRIVGRTLDLEAAYKQMLVSEKSLWASVLSVEDPDGKQKLFLSHVLPFGALASVYASKQNGQGAACCRHEAFGLVWSQYFDDFPQLDLAKSGDAGQRTAERFLDLVGWQYSCKTSKRRSASRVFDILGVTSDFNHSEQGLFHVKNKESRVEQVVQQIDDITPSNFLPMFAAASLRGRVQFVPSARCNHWWLWRQGQKDELMWMRAFVLCAEPRVLRANMSDRRVVVFTDAALEGDNCGSKGLTAYYIWGWAVRCFNQVWFSKQGADDNAWSAAVTRQQDYFHFGVACRRVWRLFVGPFVLWFSVLCFCG